MSTMRSDNKDTTDRFPPSFLFSGEVGKVNYVVSDQTMNDFIDAVGTSLWEYDFRRNLYYYLEDKIAGYDARKKKPGMTTEEWKSRVHPDDFDQVVQTWNAYIDGGHPFWFEYREMLSDGKWHWFISTVNKVDRDRRGRPWRAVGVKIEVTRIKHETLRRDRSEKQLRMIFNNAGIGIGVADSSGVLKRVNPNWVKISGYTREYLLGRSILEFVCPEERDELKKMIDVIGNLKKKRIVKQMRFINKSGAVDWEDITLTAYDNPNAESTLIILMDNINEQKRLEEQLQFAATHDPLTGLYNRAYLTQRLEEYWQLSSRHHRPLTYCMADIDHFKRINDKYGHQTGDAALKHFAKVLQEEARLSDVVGRYGGEEFVVILPETDLAGAMPCFERIRSRLQQDSVHFAENSISFTVTFGLATLMPGWSAEDLIRRADKALYQGKKTGRDKIVSA